MQTVATESEFGGDSPIEIARKVEAYVNRVVSRTGIRGVYVAMSIRGRRCYVSDATDLRLDRRPGSPEAFPISCIIKPLLAMVAVELSARKSWLIDETPSAYLGELRGSSFDRGITCSQLISHTAGYQGSLCKRMLSPGWTRSELLEFLVNAQQIFLPGSVFNYDHTSAGLLAEVLERAFGESSASLLRKHILQPFGIESFTCDELGLDSLASGFSSTANLYDLLALWEALISKSLTVPSRTSLSKQTCSLLLRRVVSLPRSSYGLHDEMPTGFTAGLATFNGGFVGYDGSVGDQALGFRVNEELGIAIALGVRAGGQLYRRALMSGIAAHILTPPQSAPGVSRLKFDIKELEGNYVGNQGIRIVVKPVHRTVNVLISHQGNIKKTLSGGIGPSGDLTFPNVGFGKEPTFFRDPTSGDPCLMIGMCAFRRA